PRVPARAAPRPLGRRRGTCATPPPPATPADRVAGRLARSPRPGSMPPARHPRPTRSRLRAGRGCRSPWAPAPAAVTRSLARVRGGAEERPDLEPFVDRLAAGPRSGGELPGQLDRALPGVHVDDEPAGDEVLGLGERTVGHRWAPLAVVPHERHLGRQRLPLDILPGLLQAGREVAHVPQVRVDLLRRPLIHRRQVDYRGRAAPVVLQQQVLHGVTFLRHQGPSCPFVPWDEAGGTFSTPAAY